MCLWWIIDSYKLSGTPPREGEDCGPPMKILWVWTHNSLTIVDHILSVCCLDIKGWAAVITVFWNFNLSTQLPLHKMCKQDSCKKRKRIQTLEQLPGKDAWAAAKTKSSSIKKHYHASWHSNINLVNLNHVIWNRRSFSHKLLSKLWIHEPYRCFTVLSH